MSFSMATPSGEGSNLDRNETKSRLTNGSPPFDLEKELQAIPALRPEEFQRRIQANKVQQPRLSSPAQTDLHLSSAVATAKKTKAQKQNPSPAATPQAHHQQQLHQPHQQVHQQGHAAAAAAPVVAATKSQWDASQRHWAALLPPVCLLCPTERPWPWRNRAQSPLPPKLTVNSCELAAPFVPCTRIVLFY